MRTNAAYRLAARAAGLAALVLAGGCNARPTAEVTGVKFSNLSLTGLTLVFDVKVDNPYSLPLPLVNLDYSLASGGTGFLSGQADLQGDVPAKASKTLQLPAQIAFPQLLSALSGVRLGSVVPYAAEMGLSVDVPVLGRQRLPLKKEGQLPVPAPPAVDIAEIKLDKVGLSEISGKADLKLVNQNSFAMDLSAFHYALSIGDVEVARSTLSRPVAFAANGGAGSLEIPISVSPQSVGLGILNVLRGEGAGYRLGGSLEVGTPFGPMTMPLEKTGRALFKR